MYLAFMKVNFLLVSPRNVKFDPEKILYWPIFVLWTMEGIYFQFLKSPHSSPLGKIFSQAAIFAGVSKKLKSTYLSNKKSY